MNACQKIEWVHNALQEAINGSADEAMLQQALELVEDIREDLCFSKNEEVTA